MTEWLPFEEEEIEFGFEDALGPQLGAGLSEVINASVQQSLSRALAVSVPQRINQAVLAALKPLTQQFDSFVKKQGLAPLPEEKVREGPETATTPQVSSWPHDGALSALAKASADHVYCSLPSTSKGPLLEVADSSDSDSTSSKSSHSSGTLRKHKRARKSSSSQGKDRSHSPSNPFQFNPEDIIHPCSANWAPAQAVADYLHDKLRKGFDKEVRNRLRAECPRPEIPDKDRTRKESRTQYPRKLAGLLCRWNVQLKFSQAFIKFDLGVVSIQFMSQRKRKPRGVDGL
ncbi:hypothetical protein NDU88_004893 [Pleurodeles waltl]|uniref:Uncharacterized protein n=1 Tax=Pleurodeles waltl TaxID=8319 RepID=A0AAV7RI50_PLEWA|nr:hypothetical protein NDU88_004893 [Pleurodeles waltl]